MTTDKCDKQGEIHVPLRARNTSRLPSIGCGSWNRVYSSKDALRRDVEFTVAGRVRPGSFVFGESWASIQPVPPKRKRTVAAKSKRRRTKGGA